jgi:hypothetical protein
MRRRRRRRRRQRSEVEKKKKRLRSRWCGVYLFSNAYVCSELTRMTGDRSTRHRRGA